MKKPLTRNPSQPLPASNLQVVARQLLPPLSPHIMQADFLVGYISCPYYPMPKPNSPPLEAVLLPDAKPRKSWVPFIMGSILVGSCLMAVVFGIWGLARLM